MFKILDVEGHEPERRERVVKKADIQRQMLARHSIEHAPEGVFWANSAGLFRQVNPRFCEMLGYTEEELQVLHIFDLATDWGRPQWPELWQRFQERNLRHYHGGLATKFGDVVQVEISADLLQFEGEELMCGFVRDIASRERNAGALMADLKASAERFRLLYDNAPVMLQACDFETRLFSVNKYWLDTLGYEWNEVIGRQTLEFMTEDTRKRVIGKVLPILRQTGSIHDFEYQLVKKSGEVIDVALTAVSDLDNDGRIIRTLSMILPISDRKRAERLESQIVYLREELTGEFNSSEIIGTSAAMHEIFRQIDMVAGTDATVLLLGETGTGKELVARAIHKRSNHADGVMVKVNCGALPSGLVESELFGHEKGAFTGALTRKKGRFELAHNSTIFLDEVGELPADTQTRLLRVLQEQEVERVGGTETIKVDVRVIAATNRNLEEEVRNGRFRSDLYYRLHIFPIRMPPLRERTGDIPLLAGFFVRKFATRFGKSVTGIDRRAIDKLTAWHWPGNVRELANILERAVILCNGTTLLTRHIGLSDIPLAAEDPIPTLEQNERRLILKALERCGGRLAGPGGAAALLDVNRSTLWSRMQKLGLKTAKPARARPMRRSESGSRPGPPP